MPKLKKRKNVPSQRKRRKAPSPKPFADHTYFTPEEDINVTVRCLQEEVEMSNSSNEMCDDNIEPQDTSVTNDITMVTEHLQPPSEEYVQDLEGYEPIEIEECDEPVVECNDHHVVDLFEELKNRVMKNICPPYTYSPNSDSIQIVEFYPSTDKIAVKLNVSITRNFAAKVYVHRIEVDPKHDFWIGLPTTYDNIASIQMLLLKLSSYTVCTGNFEAELIDTFPVGTSIETATDSTQCRGFHEGDFGATKGTISYSSTVRNINCSLLVQGKRCSPCTHIRKILISRRHRRDEKRRKSEGDTPNYLSTSIKHSNMSKEELISKICQQKEKISSLQSEIAKMQRQFQREVANKGVTLDVFQSLEMKDTMAACTSEMEKAFPNANSYQRLFWMEQLKSMNVKSSKGMRWHPMILRWCLYLRQKSSAAYDALRDSGFVTLPSSRTLFDYSHFTRTANGFQPDVIKVLRDEAEKRGMYNTDEPWKSYVGILFDEIKVKSELVYDKHTGELIGYCDLDKVGNQIMDFEKHCNNKTDSDVAKYMLVLMVRGVTTDLKFPLAGFATLSITADFLYPIIWKAIRILETSIAQLKVLFLTCDGASANRKFFSIHGQVNDFVHFTVNPYSDDDRKIYFISDVPHLIKTTRNCFSNSYSHKNTRKLWNDGKDISWIHLLRLFEDHCETSIYSPCPKITRNHLDITAFSCMKVSLAAQILSSSVANALEMMYADNVSETVNFIRTMNRFFDCLNVRNLYEGRNKRNPDLNPYTSTDDDRLRWLKEDFLDYFTAWEHSVMNRPGDFTLKQRKGMLLSHQTLTGLKISINSIVDCVKLLLDSGAKFVLTHNFNQDPLEQHFGHYRHRVGDNNNPTIYDARHMMTQMRAVGAQALAPKRGNITNQENRDFRIDNTKLQKRH